MNLFAATLDAIQQLATWRLFLIFGAAGGVIAFAAGWRSE